MIDNKQIMDWFRYGEQLCRASPSCEDCPLVGYQAIDTGISHLRCETGRNRKPKEKTNDERARTESDETNQRRDDESTQ